MKRPALRANCMKSVLLLATALVVLCALAQDRVWAADTADCTGLVLDENGVPVVGAHLRLNHGSGKVFQRETDSVGHFAIRDLPTGEYTVEVGKEGFFLLSGQQITLHAGLNEVHFTLNHE